MYLVLKERKGVCGNIYWDKDKTPREEMHRIREELCKHMQFVSLFPEGDGITFSLEGTCKDLSMDEELFLFQLLEEVLGDYQTNLLNEKIMKLINS